MIKFFRKIRQRLLTENKFSKYLIYAIGEIILVVVGILIALQVNNWNNYTNDRALENEFLNRVKKDVLADRNYFEKRAKESTINVTNYELAVAKLYQTPKNWTDVREIASLINLSTIHLTIQDFTFSELTNSGKFALISNNAIKDSLNNYYKQADAVAKHVKELNEWSVVKFNSFYSYHPVGSFRFAQRSEFPSTLSDILEIMNDPSSDSFKSYEQMIGAYHLKNETFAKYFEEMNARAIGLIEVINYHLESEMK